MFNRDKQKAALGAISEAVESGKPLITGSTAIMLKGMGINPAEIEVIARDLIGAISGVGDRLGNIEARLSAIEARLNMEPVAKDSHDD